MAPEQIAEHVDDEKEKDDPSEHIEHGQEKIAERPVRGEYVHDALPPLRTRASRQYRTGKEAGRGNPSLLGAQKAGMGRNVDVSVYVDACTDHDSSGLARITRSARVGLSLDL